MGDAWSEALYEYSGSNQWILVVAIAIIMPFLVDGGGGERG